MLVGRASSAAPNASVLLSITETAVLARLQRHTINEIVSRTQDARRLSK